MHRRVVNPTGGGASAARRKLFAGGWRQPALPPPRRIRLRWVHPATPATSCSVMSEESAQTMCLNAYILAEDPTWCETSVLSYYNLVNKIVVSYEQGNSRALRASRRIEQCLSRLRSVDTAG